MANFCTSCGGELQAGQPFCKNCGTPTKSAGASQSGRGGAQAPSGPPQPVAPQPVAAQPVAAQPAMNPMILILSVGVVVIALGIGYLLFQNLNSEEAAAPAPTTQALSTQEPAPAPPADAVGSLDGSIWVGTMKNGKYSFRMKLSESAGGGLTASMYQKNTANGDDGDQALTGSRQGTEVNLQGTSWSGAPAGWTTDTIKFTVTGGGVRSMNGQYTCANCSGWSDITGDMVP